MNAVVIDPGNPPPPVASPHAADRGPHPDPVWLLARELSRASTATMAALRRHHPGQVTGTALFDMQRILNAAGLADVSPALRERWALLLHCLALAGGRHDSGAKTGQVLAIKRVSEARVKQLLDADPSTLDDLLPRLARRLDAANATVNWNDLRALLFGTLSRVPGDRLDVAAREARLRIVQGWIAGASAGDRSAAASEPSPGADRPA